MGFFDELKKEISQAVTELVGDEEMLPEEEVSQDDAMMQQAVEEEKEEYLDEDDYIETEEDYTTGNVDMGLVVDEYASDEYVNTLDIDIADLVKSYSSELNENQMVDAYNTGYMGGYSEQPVYAEQYEDTYAMEYPQDDDVMVNTLDADISDDSMFNMMMETVEGESAVAIEEPVIEEQVVEDVIVEEEPEVIAEEPIVEEEPEVIAEEPIVEEEPEVIAEELIAEEEPEAVVEEIKEVVEEVEEVIPVQPEIEQEPETIPEPKTIAIPQPEEEKVDVQEEIKVEKIPEIKEEITEDYSDETAIITKGLTVKGDLEAEGSINIMGTVEGNILCKGKMVVSGSIYGNSETRELFANNAHINGNIVSSGSVKIGQGSVIIGNVTGTSAVIAGAVKGDIDVKGPVVVDSSAIVMGDIKSKSVQINIGAAIEGRCSQCYADVSPTSFFKEK